MNPLDSILVPFLVTSVPGYIATIALDEAERGSLEEYTGSLLDLLREEGLRYVSAKAIAQDGLRTASALPSFDGDAFEIARKRLALITDPEAGSSTRATTGTAAAIALLEAELDRISEATPVLLSAYHEALNSGLAHAEASLVGGDALAAL